MARPVVIDAMVALRLAEHDRFEVGDAELVAPRLLWSECTNVLHRSMVRRGMADGPERVLFERILNAPIAVMDEYDPASPWDISSLLGWRKTYEMPDAPRPSAKRFVARVANADVKADLDEVFEAAREGLGYRRKELTFSRVRMVAVAFGYTLIF